MTAIDAWVPLFLFSVLFALSMDYQVFLMSRIKERYDQTGSTREAVDRRGRLHREDHHRRRADHRGRLPGFARGQLVMFQQMGFGVAVALLLDATLIRMVILPSTLPARRAQLVPAALAQAGCPTSRSKRPERTGRRGINPDPPATSPTPEPSAPYRQANPRWTGGSPSGSCTRCTSTYNDVQICDDFHDRFRGPGRAAGAAQPRRGRRGGHYHPAWPAPFAFLVRPDALRSTSGHGAALEEAARIHRPARRSRRQLAARPKARG